MGRTTTAMVVLVLALVAAQPARADYEAGQKAWDAGSVGEALIQWRAAADASERRAMLALGRLYLQGLGVIQDYVEAHKWLNLAASRGEAAALEERDALAAQMTPAQIATAQERAATWRPGAGRADGARETTGAQATATTPAPAPVADSGSDAGSPPPRAIREAQELLGALGYRPGPADGVWGRRTAEAYQAFLRDAGLPAAGTLTPDALRAMRAVAGRGDAGAVTGPGKTAVADAVQAPAEASAPRPAPVRPDALHRAAQAGDIEGLTAALEADVDIDARDGRGWTALMHAVNKGYLLLVEPLLAAKADPDVRAADGATALFMAALHGHSEIVGLLMKAGADLSVRGPQGRTAVDVARVRYGDAEAARSNGEDFGIVALVQGMTWAEAQDAQKAVDEMVASLNPKCASRTKIIACWQELADKTGCYFWINSIFGSHYGPSRNGYGYRNTREPYYSQRLKWPRITSTGFTPRWSGTCSGNMHGSVAVGSGTLTLVWRDNWTYNNRSFFEEYSVRESGLLKNGKKQDRWTIQMVREGGVGRSLSFKDEGGYVDGKRQGNWVERGTKSVWQRTYMNDRLDGRYTYNDDSGLSDGTYRNGKKHGKWYDKISDRSWVSHWNYGNPIENQGKKNKKTKMSHESDGGR